MSCVYKLSGDRDWVNEWESPMYIPFLLYTKNGIYIIQRQFVIELKHLASSPPDNDQWLFWWFLIISPDVCLNCFAFYFLGFLCILGTIWGISFFFNIEIEWKTLLLKRFYFLVSSSGDWQKDEGKLFDCIRFFELFAGGTTKLCACVTSLTSDYGTEKILLF